MLTVKWFFGDVRFSEREAKQTALVKEKDILEQADGTHRFSNHTSVIHISKTRSIELIPNTEIEIYLYHDAKMAEVRKFNGKKQFWLRNKYPNKNMLSKDEKFQWNFFLEEFLSHTKKYGLGIVKLH